jgi:UbiD family decarboxylase
MEDFYIGGASMKLFLPIFKMNFSEIVAIALPAEGVFHNLVFVSIRKTNPMQAYKIMHGLWGMGQMMFTKYIVVVDDDVDVHNTSEVLFRFGASTLVNDVLMQIVKTVDGNYQGLIISRFRRRKRVKDPDGKKLAMAPPESK